MTVPTQAPDPDSWQAQRELLLKKLLTISTLSPPLTNAYRPALDLYQPEDLLHLASTIAVTAQSALRTAVRLAELEGLSAEEISRWNRADQDGDAAP